MVKAEDLGVSEEERQASFEKLSRDLSEVLDGHAMHVVIPSLTSLISQSAAMSGMPKDVLILYMMNCMDKVYKEYEKVEAELDESSPSSLH
jgi:hypothetical protein